MAQSENTELRDLVIDALEKNGSLAKIRALLRANIFLAFEEDCENVKHNPSLDNILQMPEGLLSLSLIHEFLEYCNLRNTMFVYVSESRQGKEYKYEGRKRLAERFGSLKRELTKEPLLVTIIKTILTSRNTQEGRAKTKSSYKNDIKDEENCTYIVNEDSSSVSSHGQTQSDNSSDEKNKLMFRLPIDNSDTDTSSDSTHTHDKTSSEYIANENIIVDGDSEDDSKKSLNGSPSQVIKSSYMNNSHDEFKIFSHNKPDILNPHSSDSTSYIEFQRSKLVNTKLETFDMVDSRLQNNESNKKSTLDNQSSSIKSSNSNIQTLSIKQEDIANENVIEKINIDKSDIVASDYSLDFSMSEHSSHNNNSNKESPVKDDPNMNGSSFINDSPRNETHSTRSSVSISDVADLLDIDSPLRQRKDNKENFSSLLKENQISKGKMAANEESEDFSVSSVPSLSNLSLDLNSD